MSSLTPDQPLSVVVLAAGKGKRMRSRLPKVLQSLGGKPLLGYVLASAAALQSNATIVVVGVGAEAVEARYGNLGLSFAMQKEQLGTGHALMQALPHLGAVGKVLVLNGDVPLIQAATLARLLAVSVDEALVILTQVENDAAQYGRVVRDAEGKIERIVEFKDATPEQRQIHEWYTGTMVIPASRLSGWLAKLSTRNAQTEYYLTDLVALAAADGVPVVALNPTHDWEVKGVNTPAELAQLERKFQHLQAQALLDHGTQLADPARLDVRGKLTCGDDVWIDVNCVFEGEVHLADGVSVGANCVIRNASIGPGTRVEPFSSIDGAQIGADARIGPYARIRPETQLADGTHIGNFVEVKASSFGAGSKANHLAYIGDANVGSAVNIGAGTITCNYDGAHKHRTTIEDRVHVGSDVQLVAPVTVGAGATIAAGTTVWQDVPPGELSLNPKQQVTKPGWRRPTKP